MEELKLDEIKEKQRLEKVKGIDLVEWRGRLAKDRHRCEVQKKLLERRLHILKEERAALEKLLSV